MFTKEQLVNVGAGKLADAVLLLCKLKPDVKKEFKLILAGFHSEPNSDPFVKKIKKDIGYLDTYIWSFNMDYNDSSEEFGSDSLPIEIDRIRNYIMQYSLPKSPDQAIELLQNLLDNHEYILDEVDNSNDFVADRFLDACKDLATAYEHSSTKSVEEIVQEVHDRYLNNKHRVYSSIIEFFKNALGNEGLKQLKQKFEHSFNEKNAKTIRAGMKKIADYQNNVDDYIHACTFTGELSSLDNLEIVKRLIKHQRGQEAIKWLDSADFKGCHYSEEHWQQKKTALKIDALHSDGKYKEAQVERQKWFDICLSTEVYNDILKYGETASIDSWKKTALLKVFQMPNSLTALNFFIEIQELKLAAKLVCEKIDCLHIDNNSTLYTMAKKLCEISPLAATLLYRKMIGKHSSGYFSLRDSAEYLALCHKLNSKITDWHGHKNHQLYVRELRKQYKRKGDFWNDYETVIKKSETKKPK